MQAPISSEELVLATKLQLTQNFAILPRTVCKRKPEALLGTAISGYFWAADIATLLDSSGTPCFRQYAIFQWPGAYLACAILKLSKTFYFRR